MIAKKNDFLYRVQQLTIQQMQQMLQFGSVTIPSYKGDLKGCFKEARGIMTWAEEVVNTLEGLKENEPDKTDNTSDAKT